MITTEDTQPTEPADETTHPTEVAHPDTAQPEAAQPVYAPPDESVFDTVPEDGENRHITSDGQTCQCAEHADIVDGRCRRCGLTGTAQEPASVISEDTSPSLVETPAQSEPAAETPEVPVVEAPVTVIAPE